MSSLFNTLKQLAVAAGVQGEDTKIQFSMKPSAGESGFQQWHGAMKMVARLSGGIPHEFRKTLWLTLAERHITSKNINWSKVERTCFNDLTNPDDEELGVQIVKDLHRTGCSLFCGTSGEQNQAVLKRVLLAYARWNKSVGYCQGFNMLAALILEVMDRCEYDSLKVMIYLIEGVLPESYFANSLRGLSIDMAVFRDLLRLKLPELSRHLEQLQTGSNDAGNTYEPPLTNVFTMQWFLTLFCNCLPHSTVLRVWDLVFLEGNQVLLKTALAIWDTLSDRIMPVKSADEFYSIMGVLTREMLEFGLMDANCLVKTISNIELSELTELRERYIYNITPWTQVARKGLRLFYSDDETDDSDEDANDDKTSEGAYGFLKAATKQGSQSIRSISPSSILGPFASEREKIALDISALKKQYCKIKERQRQAQIIFTAACNTHGFMGSMVSSTPAPAINHLLLSKNAAGMSKASRIQKQPQKPPTIPVSRAVQRLRESSFAPGEDTHKERGETVYWDKRMKKKRKRRRTEINFQNNCYDLTKLETDAHDSDSSTTTTSSSSSLKSSSSTELCDDLAEFDSEDANTSISDSCCSPHHRRQSSVMSLVEDLERHTNQVEESPVTAEQAHSKPELPFDTSGYASSDYVHEHSTVPAYESDRERILNLLLTTSIIASEQLSKQEGPETADVGPTAPDVELVDDSKSDSEDASQKRLNQFIHTLNKLSRTVSDTTEADGSKIFKTQSVDSISTTKDCVDETGDVNDSFDVVADEGAELESALEHMKIDALEILFASSTLESIRNDSHCENEDNSTHFDGVNGAVENARESDSVASGGFLDANTEIALQTILHQNTELLKKVNQSYTSYESNIDTSEDANRVPDSVQLSIAEAAVNYPKFHSTEFQADNDSDREFSKERELFDATDCSVIGGDDSAYSFDTPVEESSRLGHHLSPLNVTPSQGFDGTLTLAPPIDTGGAFKASSPSDLSLDLAKCETDEENDDPRRRRKKKHKSLESLNATPKSKLQIGLVSRTGKWISISIDNSDLAVANTRQELAEDGAEMAAEVETPVDAEAQAPKMKTANHVVESQLTDVPGDPYLHLNFDIIATGKKKKDPIQEYVHKKNVLSQSYRSPELTTWNYNPFPSRPSNRPPKELGVKLGLYTSNKK